MEGCAHTSRARKNFGGMQAILTSMPATRKPVRLIINADDFGLTCGVNRAITELASSDVLTSATLMAQGAAFEDAVQCATNTPALRTGCHIVLVDGVACAPPDQVPTLATNSGQLRTSLPRFLLELQRGRIHEHEIELEAVAQIRRVQAAGLRVTHVDTHKHTHLFPRVARPLMRAAISCGVPAIRNPFEQEWSARLTRGSLVRKLEVRLLRGFQSSFTRLLRAAGLRSTDGSIGVSATGSLDEAALRLLLDRAEPGTWELVCHPGYNDSDLQAVTTRLRGTRDVERQALLKLLPEAVQSKRIQLVSFADL